ncbi:MAG: 3-dehydroquinate synthase [Bacteroidota bacterium]|nr:3-dehydroquinate synthase [Bacteroidota bacterium]
MKTIVKQTIKLGSRSYPICLGNRIINHLAEVASAESIPKNIAIITDQHVAPLHLKRVVDILRRHDFRIAEILIAPGERQKSIPTATKIITKLVKSNIERESTLFALGGGVVGDVTGFVAATYRRGVQLVQLPTTLLAMVESSIGGKTAVNHPLAKNAIGAFYQPKFVFSDVQFLQTLPSREVICGLGEVLKYAILDKNIFNFLYEHLNEILQLDLDVTQELILLCNTYKAKLIETDEFEKDTKGGRTVLNLGHTIGHALENLSKYKLHHGEAVLIGLKWELEIAGKAQIIDQNYFENISSLLERVAYHPKLNFLNYETLIRQIFKNGKKARFILPQTFGKVFITDKLKPSLIKAVIKRQLGK